MSKTQRKWTIPEVKLLEELAAQGFRGPQIGQALDRTRNSVAGKCLELGIKLPRGGSLPKKSAIDRINDASGELREAILDLFVRVSNDTGKNMPEVRAMLLGKEPECRPDGHYFGTSSIRRLAA